MWAEPTYKGGVEVELKLGLASPGDLRVLLAVLPSPEAELVQHNHYYADPTGVLSRRRIMVRVREEKAAAGCGEPDRVLLTVKERTAVEDGIFRANEREAELTPKLWAAVRGGHMDVLELEVAPATWLRSEGFTGTLEYQGGLVNRRHRVVYQGYTLEIDQTSFDDGAEDVEIEVEGTRLEPIRQALMELCQAHDIELFTQTRGKYARFLSRLRG